VKYLVDANVLSEPTKPTPDPQVVEWLRAHERDIAVDPYNYASSGKSVGNGERQRAVSVRNRQSFRQVESNDLCSSSPP
jgi:predicted nucleic acid-binding protein